MSSWDVRGARVYFAQAIHGGPIKIGHSINVEGRLEAVGKDLPFDLIEIGSVPGGLFAERFVQCWFRKSQIKGEWFEPTSELWRWALAARTKHRIFEIPDSPGCSYAAETKTILHFFRYTAGANLKALAESSGLAQSSIDAAFKKTFIDSTLLLAATAVLFVRAGTHVDWDRLHRLKISSEQREQIPPLSLAQVSEAAE
jgi:hypothetical protein